jgi:Xaa-Pro aminopeptidase
MTTGAVDEAARSVVRDAGFDREFLHVTGHGIGFRYHEPAPLICPDGDLALESGMVHTVEPGIYFPGFGGMRIEDDVLITGNGCEILGPYKKELE